MYQDVSEWLCQDLSKSSPVELGVEDSKVARRQLVGEEQLVAGKLARRPSLEKEYWLVWMEISRLGKPGL